VSKIAVFGRHERETLAQLEARFVNRPSSIVDSRGSVAHDIDCVLHLVL
jgi:hypothetical protein